MVVAVGVELELVLDPAEERRRRVEDEAVAPELERVGEAGAAVGVGLGARDLLVALQQLDRDAGGRPPAAVSSTWVESEALIP